MHFPRRWSYGNTHSSSRFYFILFFIFINRESRFIPLAFNGLQSLLPLLTLVLRLTQFWPAELPSCWLLCTSIMSSLCHAFQHNKIVQDNLIFSWFNPDWRELGAYCCGSIIVGGLSQCTWSGNISSFICIYWNMDTTTFTFNPITRLILIYFFC